ncbi:MAG: ATP-binding protein, partial [Planctomycetaceae bacterium]|nr:ATP-binding protein [Planctomycetaceae bacterium]
MKVFIKNIGVLESTKYELGDLTVVCGKNNTGKTLAAYTLYGFFDYWQNKYNFQIGTTMIKKIKNEREFRIVRKQIQPLLSKNLELAYQKYVTEYLPVVLGSSSEQLADCQFRLSIRWTLNQSLLLKRKTARWILSDCESYLVKTDDEGKSVQIFQEEHVPQDFLSNQSNLSNLSNLSDSSDSVPIIDSVQSLTKFISPEIIPCAAVVSAERIGAAMFSEEIG